MSAAEKIPPPTMKSSPWAEICNQHPDEWVCLFDVQHEPDGLIRAAQLISHHRSIKEALERCPWTNDPLVVYAHTGGRKLRFPRIEMTDEIRDTLRARR